MRDYEPLWDRIKQDYIYARDNNLQYAGTIAYEIPPHLFERVCKSVSNEKGWHAKDTWPESRYTKLRVSYDVIEYTITFKLQPHRVMELKQRHLRRLI